MEAGVQISPGVIAVPVGRPKRRWLDPLVALKRCVTSRRDEGTAGLSTLRPDGPESPTARTSLAARFRERYLGVVYFIDRFKKWSWRAAGAAVRAGREYGAALVLVSGPPHSTLLAGAWAARRLGIPFVADMRDPWSDALAVSHPERRVELRLLRALESWAMRRAAAVTSTSAKTAALLVERDPTLALRVHVIRNGFDDEIAPALAHTGGRLSILYAGALYAHRTPYPLLEALERLLARRSVDPGRVQLTFIIGDQAGASSEQSLNRWMQGKSCLAVVRILPRQNAASVAQEVARATVLVNLAQHQHLHVPAKTFEQLASGREILLIGEADCETAQVTAGIRGVTRVDQSDPQILDAAMLDLYQRHVVAARACVPAAGDVRRFSRTLSNERFAALLSALTPLTIKHQPPSTELELVV